VVDRGVVQARIAKMRQYVALLRRIGDMSDERRFVSDPLVHGNAERYLQLAIQAVLDISNHIAADMSLGLPADHRALFTLLARRRVLSNRLADKLTSMAGFRNILVHEYLEIDRHLVYRALKENLGDFERFIRAVSKLL
jgi:uncharacterized protein YutE (UPF0331/DUF86 family)